MVKKYDFDIEANLKGQGYTEDMNVHDTSYYDDTLIRANMVCQCKKKLQA